MVTNDFLPYAIGGGANVETQGNYAVDPALSLGQQPGIASSAFNNKALRQANAIVSQVAQYLANQTQTNVQDNGVTAQMLSQIMAAFQPALPIYYSFLSAGGSGTFNLPLVFYCASANATVGATYTNNGNTYTVYATVASSLSVIMTGNALPTAGGTLTKATGTGDATITFYAYRTPSELKCRMVGGGGGGSGGASSGSGASGSVGTSSNFGPNSSQTNPANASAGGGGSGNYASAGGSGGTATQGSSLGIATITASGGGGCGSAELATTFASSGGLGGASALGGAGNAVYGAQGGGGAANTGGGGGGGSNGDTGGVFSGAGGGSGAYLEFVVQAPTIQNWYYWVGSGGSPGTGNGGGFSGGGGGSGGIWLKVKF